MLKGGHNEFVAHAESCLIPISTLAAVEERAERAERIQRTEHELHLKVVAELGAAKQVILSLKGYAEPVAS